MHFIINLDKPKGISSHQAVSKVKKILGARKAGHAGTLDPLATGILLVCVNEATKITRFLSDMDKEYVALMKLGEKTDTLDAEGEVIRRAGELSVKAGDIEHALKKFTGAVRQTPPMYSAVKMNGKPLYKLARKGIEIERKERVVNIYDIKVTAFSLPYLEIAVSCSKGTYIRTLCDDIGDAIGVGAHIAGLKRTRIGDFRIDDAITIDRLEKLTVDPEPGVMGKEPSMVGIDAALSRLRELRLNESEFKMMSNGMPVRCAEGLQRTGGYIRLKDPSGSLFGIGRIEENLIKMSRMLHGLS